MPSKAEILAKKIFGLKKIKKLKQPGKGFEKRYKVVVFVPPVKTEEMVYAMSSAGAGTIGNYSLCSFRTQGTGTFFGNADTNPFVGVRDKFETADEDRLEMICSKENIKKVIDKIYEIHPYEEPAFEIYEVLTKSKHKSGDVVSVTLKKKTSVKSLLKLVSPEINLSNVPAVMKKIKVRKCLVDCSDCDELISENIGTKILYINEKNNKIKAYLT